MPLTKTFRLPSALGRVRIVVAAASIALTGALMLALPAPAAAQTSGDLAANLSFAPATIASGKPTALRVRLNNTNDGSIQSIAFDIVYVAGMRRVGTLDPAQCRGTLTEFNGGVQFRGGSLAPNDSCEVGVDVTVDSDVTNDVTQSIGPITSNGGGSVSKISATLTVIGGIPPKITSPPLPPLGDLGLDYFHQVTVSGTPPVVVTAEGLPPGLAYDDAVRRITGKPNLAGMYLVTLRATNGFAPPDGQVSPVEIRNPPLQIITPPPLSAARLMIGVPIVLVVEATGGLKPYVFELAQGSLPPGLALATDGRISGAPTTPGIYPFVVSVRDVLNQNDSRAYELTVGRIPTTVKFSLAPNPAVAGQVVVLNATVEGTSGLPPAGTLDAWAAGPGSRCPDPFESGADPVTPTMSSAPVVGGAAQVAFANLAVGRFRVCALYGGSLTNEPSMLGPIDLFVIKGILLPSPKMTLDAPAQAIAGRSVSGRVTLEAAGTSLKPGGTVRVRAGTRDLGELPLANGVAVFSIVAPEEPGVMTLTSSYAGDGAFSPAASDPVYVAVIKAVVSQPIPVLGEAALGLLALLLAVLSAARLRRRR